MILLFLRHAEAEPIAQSDSARRLTPKGLEQAAKVGKFFLRSGLLPDLILTSPVTRARQTAEIVAEKLGQTPPVLCSWLACGMSPATCLDELTAYANFEQILLVGHEPDFSSTISALLGCSGPGSVRVRKASVTSVSLAGLRGGAGELQFALPVRLM